MSNLESRASGGCDLSIVIACYNEESHLSESVRQIRLILDSTRWNYELIFIDDKSQDNTREVIQKLVEGRNDCTAVYHESNLGRGGTVTEGIRLARGKIVGFIDIDLEVQSHYIPAMVQKLLQEGYDIATGERIYRVMFQFEDIIRWILSIGYRRLVYIVLKGKFRDTETGYKFFLRDKILPVLDRCMDTHWFWDTEIMLEAADANLKIIEIPVLFMRRLEIKSSVRLLPDTWAYIVALTNYYKRKKKKASAQS